MAEASLWARLPALAVDLRSIVHSASFNAPRRAVSLACATARRADWGTVRLKIPSRAPDRVGQALREARRFQASDRRLRSSVSSRVNRAGMTSMVDMTAS